MVKFLEKLWAVVRSKQLVGKDSQLVGKDSAGNAFYRHSRTVDGAERRWVEYVGDPNPKNLPVEWYSWLSARRKDAPTPEESMALEAYRQRVKKNAAIIAKEEENRRFRQMALQQDGNIDAIKPPDMKKFIQQVAAVEGIDLDGEDKASMNEAVQDKPSIEENQSIAHENDLQDSRSSGRDDHGPKVQKGGDGVYERWVPPS